jgi:molecular chaperone HtpG
MPNISLPNSFKEKLDKNQELDGIVKSVAASYAEILGQNNLYFFPEYTDHGLKHIENLLSSGENLITKKTMNNTLSEKDITYFILSVILHDLGMHINLDGFVQLIRGDYDDIRISELDRLTWKELWDSYLGEANRFSGRQLQAIFGDENLTIKIPQLGSPGSIDENDKKLIGEFLRRHHARLAHEISIKGFPFTGSPISFAEKLDVKNRNLIGIIARSHGENLRSCVDHIEREFGRPSRRFPLGVHATYLMVLLRLADFIQIDNSRTTSLRSRELQSPISKREHDAHLAIDNVDTKWHDDPERIHVTASPKDSKMYLKLLNLFSAIQKEFDTCWAVLGELYGKTSEGDKAEIRFRRISSNLTDNAFTERQSYIADEFSINANDEIIKLLVAPLYGNDPKFGVRELLQNAVDACRERVILENKNSAKYTPQITVELRRSTSGGTIFKITDNGIGMSVEVIKNYFLSAGSSYRKSHEWQSKFANDKGESIVPRSGRFGVGILASFLVGQKINVSTRQSSAAFGYSFETSITQEQIDVIKDSTLPVGTSVEIVIDDAMKPLFEIEKKAPSEIRWMDWYLLSFPSVRYLVEGEEIIPYNRLDPDVNEVLPATWQSFDSDGYTKILWTYSKEFATPDFSCNGIVIPELGYDALDLNLISYAPKISVFDNDGRLPLTLDRNTIAGRPTFNDDLLADLYRDLIAFTLIYTKQSGVGNNTIMVGEHQLGHPGTRTSDYANTNESMYGRALYEGGAKYVLQDFLNSILVSKDGFILNYNYFIRKLGGINMLLIQGNDLKGNILSIDIGKRFALLTENRANSISDYLSNIEGRTWNSVTKSIDPCNSRLFIKTDKYNYLFHSDIKRASAWLKQKVQLQFQASGFTCFHLDQPEPSIISTEFLERYRDTVHLIRESRIDCYADGDQMLNSLLERYLGNNVVIPYNLEDRKTIYPLAFKELDRYMLKYR